MAAILKAVELDLVKRIEPKVVVSNRPDSPGLRLARKKFGVPTHVLSNSHDKDRLFEHELVKLLEEYGVHPTTGMICLAGFMRILGPTLVKRYRMRILNIHPSLLPSFRGLHAQKQALDYGAKITGCTVHFVDEGVDTGPILMQKAVPIFDRDTEESLTQRILKAEHTLYPEALRLFSESRLRIKGRRISIEETKL